MIRVASLSLAILLPLPALAHTGHWGELAGHDHWIGLGLLGLAGLAGLAAILKDRKARKESHEDEDREPEESEA